MRAQTLPVHSAWWMDTSRNSIVYYTHIYDLIVTFKSCSCGNWEYQTCAFWKEIRQLHFAHPLY